jgi:hypothetical protein
MSLTIKQCHCKDAKERRNVIEEWVALEENDYTYELLAVEINAMMEVERFVSAR